MEFICLLWEKERRHLLNEWRSFVFLGIGPLRRLWRLGRKLVLVETSLASVRICESLQLSSELSS
jgi:hypothetical protein